jgi:hypothetical protein
VDSDRSTDDLLGININTLRYGTVREKRERSKERKRKKGKKEKRKEGRERKKGRKEGRKEGRNKSHFLFVFVYFHIVVFIFFYSVLRTTWYEHIGITTIIIINFHRANRRKFSFV